MKMTLSEPSKVTLTEVDDKEDALRNFLTYVDKKADYELKKLKGGPPWTWDMDGYYDRIAELEANRKPCLLKQDEDGTFWTYSGLAHDLQQRFRGDVRSIVEYPEADLIPWKVVPPPLYPYQQEAVDKLLAAKHGGIELATGGGKSYIAMWLAKTLGLKTIVMVPSTSIAEQMYDDFALHLGKHNVGKYWGGKHEYKKLVTIGISASLCRILPGTEEYDALCQTEVFIADECHLTPAETLQSVCFGLCGAAPYRFFVSGTVTRTDGSELLLKGITSEIVFRKTVRELVDEGFLAKPIFKMKRVQSYDPIQYGDPNKEVKAHFLLNDVVNRWAANIANAAVERLNHPTLILLDELCQFSALLPFLRVKPVFAYGGVLKKDNEKFVPPEFRGGDNAELVKGFNEGKYPLLIGTSAISTGTNIKSVRTMINLMGGKSIIATSQAVGRVTRKGQDGQKTECLVFDFDVENSDVCSRHASARAAIYNSIYGPCEYL